MPAETAIGAGAYDLDGGTLSGSTSMSGVFWAIIILVSGVYGVGSAVNWIIRLM
jgi:hypothetical protein